MFGKKLFFNGLVSWLAGGLRKWLASANQCHSHSGEHLIGQKCVVLGESSIFLNHFPGKREIVLF